MTAPVVGERRPRTAWFWALTPARASVLVGVVAVVVYLVSATYGAQQSFDTLAAELPAWKLTHHGTLALPEYIGRITWVHASHGTGYSDRLPGVVAWGMPFYAILGRDRFSNLPGGVAGAVSAALAIALVFVLAERMTTRRTALAVAAVVGLGTSMWTVAADGLWTHGPASVAVLLGLVLASRDRWPGAGVGFGLAVLVRPHLAVVGLSVGVFTALSRRRWRPLLWCGAGIAVAAVAAVLYTHALWGAWSLVPPVYDTRLRSGLVSPTGYLNDVAGTLVSPQRGVFVLSPFLLALVPGLWSAWRVAPDWARGAAVGGTLYMLVQLWGNPFGGGFYFYSYRLAIDWLVPCVPLLILAWTTWTSRTPLRRAVFLVLVGLSVFAQAVGAFGNTKWVAQAGSWHSSAMVWFATETPWRAAVGVLVAVAVVVGFVAGGYLPVELRGERVQG